MGLSLLAAACALGACGGERRGADAAVDGGGVDLGDGAVDLADGGDGDVSAPVDSEVHAEPWYFDFVQHDATLSATEALYIATADPDTFGLRTVPADGSQAPQSVAAFAGLVDFLTLSLAGRQPSPQVSSERPRAVGTAAFPAIALPGGGVIYAFRRTLTSSSGLLLVKPSGQLAVLVERPGVYVGTVGEQLALTDDGVVGAVVVSGSSLALFRSDGGTFPGGGTARILEAPPAAPELLVESVTLAGGWVFVVGKGGGDDRLLRAPADGSGELSTISLPDSAGSAPQHVAPDLLTSADGSRVVLRAGAGTAALDIYAVTVADGAAVNVTDAPGQILPRGARAGELEAALAVSPAGTRVAYVRRVEGVDRIAVRATDGTGPESLLNGASRFAEEVIAVGCPLFADEETLLFMAGVSSYQLDLYRWRVDGSIDNLTGYGGTDEPFDGEGALAARGGWTGPQGARFFFVGYTYSDQAQDIYRVALASGEVLRVSQGRRIETGAGQIAGCGARLFFVGRPDPAKAQQELFRVDQTLDQPAARVTFFAGSGPWRIDQLQTTADCTRLFFAAGGTASLSQLWTATGLGGQLDAHPVTPYPRYIGSTALLSGDGTTVVFASGGAPETMTLKAVSVLGGIPLTLDHLAGHVAVLAVQ